MRCFQSPMAVDICVCRERGTISKWHLGKRQQREKFRLPRKDNRAVIASSRITQLFWQPQDGFMGYTELGRYSGNCEVTEYVSSRNHSLTSTHLWSSGCNGPLSTGMHVGVHVTDKSNVRWFKAFPSGQFGSATSYTRQLELGVQIIKVHSRVREVIPQPRLWPALSSETRSRLQFVHWIRASCKPFLFNVPNMVFPNPLMTA